MYTVTGLAGCHLSPLLDASMSIDGYGGCAESPRNRLWPRHRRTIPFADTASWFVAGAIEDLLSKSIIADHDRIATIYLCVSGPVDTLVDLRMRLDNEQVSPLRFPAATPSSILATACTLFSLRGPSLSIFCTLKEALPHAVHVCADWLSRDVADLVILAASPSVQRARSLSLIKTTGTSVLDLRTIELWLSGFNGTAGADSSCHP